MLLVTWSAGKSDDVGAGTVASGGRIAGQHLNGLAVAPIDLRGRDLASEEVHSVHSFAGSQGFC